MGSSIPERGGHPYLWDEFFLKVGDGSITIAQIDEQQGGTFAQAKNLAIRYRVVTRFLPQYSNLYIITGSEARDRSYQRVLKHPDMERVQSRSAIPVTTYLITPSARFLAKTDPSTNPSVEQEIAPRRGHRQGGWSPHPARI